jgi:predicted transcriptional regulator
MSTIKSTSTKVNAIVSEAPKANATHDLSKSGDVVLKDIESMTLSELLKESETIASEVKEARANKDIPKLLQLASRGEKVNTLIKTLSPQKAKASSKMSQAEKQAKIKANNETILLEASQIHALKMLGYSHKDIAADIEKSPSHIQRLSKFMKLYVSDDRVKDAINDGKVSFSQVANLTDLDDQKFNIQDVYALIN